jgi:hypothetical protein
MREHGLLAEWDEETRRQARPSSPDATVDG